MTVTHWLILTVLFAVAEAVTVSLVTVWFAIGSLAALVVCFFGGKVWLQLVVFLAVSAGVLVLMRPLAKKYANGRRTPTNADRVLGKVCVVTEEIDNILGTGAVSVDGKIWTARTQDGAKLAAGTLVRPVTIQGVKLIVEPAEKETPETIHT